MNRHFRAGFAALILGNLSVSTAHADNVSVPNNSFESPATSFVSINIDSWQKTPKPDWYQETGGFLWTQLTGIFKNTATNSSDHIDNCDGNQALWLFAVPEVALFQDYDSTDWHNQPPSHQFNATFTPGKSYHLMVGVIGSGGGMAPGATLELSLYYHDPASNHVIVGVTTLTNDPAVFSNTTHLVDCRVDTDVVKLSDGWAGQHVGMQFKSTVTTNLQGGYWDLDNVRLIEGPALLNPLFASNQFSFTLVGRREAAFDILTSTNLSLPISNWLSAAVITNFTGTTAFAIGPVSAGPNFYRARQLP